MTDAEEAVLVVDDDADMRDGSGSAERPRPSRIDGSERIGGIEASRRSRLSGRAERSAHEGDGGNCRTAISLRLAQHVREGYCNCTPVSRRV